LTNNLIALVVTFVLSLAWLRLNDFTAQKGWVSGSLSRKIIHIGTGPIFVLCWLLFNDAWYARFFAALVPLASTLQFLLVGLGVLKDPAAVKAMSRTGDRKEILKGPLYYGIAFVVLTLIFWKNSPNGIVPLMVLCGGDGLADVMGKRLRSARLPWSKKKTWAGSISMLVGGWLFAVVILTIFSNAHQFPYELFHYLPGTTFIAVVAMVIESLPYTDIDNITVPVVSVLLGLLLF
jgi:phytol kinase